MHLPLAEQTFIKGEFKYNIITSNNFDTVKESLVYLFVTKDWDLGESANLAITTRKGGEVSMDLKPWEMVNLNLSSF